MPESGQIWKGKTMQYSHEEIKDFIETQLSMWPLAKKNYDALAEVERRQIKVNDYDFFLQYNPARIVSTGANIEKEKIANRKCFLCRNNRPSEQMIGEIIPGWELLVNPYPILPVHLTIVSTEHRPQSHLPKDIVEIATLLPGMAIFFNGAKAGASAPDHLHLQAVLKDELPLIRLVEKVHPESAAMVLPSDSLLPHFPFLFFTGVVRPDDTGFKTLLAGLSIGGSEDGKTLYDHELVNTFFWLSDSGILRFIAIPRTAHRPKCYYAQGDDNRMISPGCIDMAGMLITPRRKDFETLSGDEITKIYSEVAFKGKK